MEYLLNDVRIHGLILALAGICLGVFSSITVLSVITAICGVTLILKVFIRSGEYGTSGDLGMFLLILIYSVSLFVPAWLAHWLK